MPAELPVNKLPDEVRRGIIQNLAGSSGHEPVINNFTIAAGGCINHGGMLTTSSGNYFIKWNDLSQPDLFVCEANGLALLAKTNSFTVPRIYGVGVSESFQFIILEFVHGKQRSKEYWRDFGRKLAILHASTDSHFGLGYNNYIGSLRQFNEQSTSWIDFFIEKRIQTQLMLAEKNGLTDYSLRKKFDSLFKKLPEILTDQTPSLLHGDLWSGNLVIDGDGAPCLIDPAVYYGNREIELAYTQLFGGFDKSFLEAYSEAHHLEPGFESRVPVYNLYPLLVHVNLFGRTYLTQVTEILNKFI